MDTIWIIRKTTFDNLENHHPYTRETVGYTDTEEEANEHIERLLDGVETYEGWDHCTYPEYPSRRNNNGDTNNQHT